MEMMKSLDSGKLKGVKRKEAGRRKIQKLRNLEIRGVYLRAARLRRDEKVTSDELLVARGRNPAMRGHKTQKKGSPVLQYRGTLTELLDF